MTFDTPIRSHTEEWWKAINDMEHESELPETPSINRGVMGEETQEIHARAVAQSLGTTYLRRAVLDQPFSADERPIRLSVRQAG